MPSWQLPFFFIHSFSPSREPSFPYCFFKFHPVTCVFLPSPQNVEDHVAFVITVPTALAIFLAVFVLVCIESIFKKLLRVFSLVIWACLVAMGYLFMFSGGIICPWDQVRHVRFSVNTSNFSHNKESLLSVCRQLFLTSVWFHSEGGH